MGKHPVRPKMLLLKIVAALLMTTTQTMVTIKNNGVQEEVSTFTSTVSTTKIAKTTAKEVRMRTPTGTLEKKQWSEHYCWTRVFRLFRLPGETSWNLHLGLLNFLSTSHSSQLHGIACPGAQFSPSKPLRKGAQHFPCPWSGQGTLCPWTYAPIYNTRLQPLSKNQWCDNVTTIAFGW